ncbi:hypothetical protein GC175_32530 [bacterium]|nr:hypothetical protein [bacterium]
MSRDDAACPENGPQVVYRSFLLRLRIVLNEGGQTQQIYLKDIRNQAEFYFADLPELMRFLEQLERP